MVGLLAFSLVIPQAQAQDAFGPRPPRLPRPAHPALAPGGRYGPRVPPAVVAAEWARRARARLAPAFAVPPTPRAAQLPPPPAVAAAALKDSLPVAEQPRGALSPYADLGMELNVRFELKADRFENLRCTGQERLLAFSGCDPGFPVITPNPQYAVRTAGVVGQRLHVNVDFDSQREFDANNNLQVWYAGLADEILRRVEAGNVTFQTPPSRFISAAIPANNFGVQAIAQLGALELRGIYAQQKGNVVKDRTYTVGEITSQPLDREARDLDYEAGRFFFAVDPAALPAFPAVDILRIDPAPLPDSLRVGNLRVYRVRALAPTSVSNQNVGGVRAAACAPGADAAGCAVQRAGPFQWELLQEGRDYYVDPTGAWFALANRLDQSEYLAVSYVTASGADSVGTFPDGADPDTAAVDTLRLVYDPRPGVTAAAPSFRFEIRSAYRVGGSEIVRETVELTLTVNRRERTVATGETYLARLGLALANDPNHFDEYNRLFPRARDPLQGAPLRDLYVVFPHLTPFADATRLEPTERADSLYRTPRALLATQGPASVFALRLHASASASADRSLLSLNSFQIREGSERLYVGSTLLRRDADYAIDYAAGQVVFRNPDSLFQGGLAQVRAQFEERAAFAVAPTSIYGVAGRYDLGGRGHLDFTGMFQKEQSAFNRPPLGFEPSSSFIGGVSTQLRFQPAWLTRAVDALPGVRTDAPSVLNVSAEVAVSRPSPNARGQAYLEEFETEQGRFVPLGENQWQWGSRPCGAPPACLAGGRGAAPYGIAASGFDLADAAALTWQSAPLDRAGRPMQFLPQQIDPTILVAGQGQSADPNLWLALKPDTVLGLADSRTGDPNWVRPRRDGPRWRSITQPLSATGLDLSRVEFLELWVWEDGLRTASTNRTVLLLDFGSVFEDAVAFTPTAFTVSGASDTTWLGARLAGAGRLDTERDPVTRSWSATENDHGILSDVATGGIVNQTTGDLLDSLPLCRATVGGRLVSYAFGDLRSRCGRDDSAVDTEDQDGDFVLDSAAGVRTAEHFVRYVFPIGDARYFVRDGAMMFDSAAGGFSGWRLYRIPFRVDTLQVGQPSLRQVQAVRLTVVAPPTVPAGAPDPDIFLAFARVRLVGSAWLKRAASPIRGIGGDRGTGAGEVVASVVSTENRDLGYEPPPGVFDEAGRRDANLQIGATQINERSLRLLARGLGVGERAEAFLRFTNEGDKNFLKYRRLRAWARGRGPGWDGGGGGGGGGDLEFYLKVGKDPHNFYLYRTSARTTTWEPEVVVDFGRWLALRAAIEQVWLRGDTAQVYAGCPDSTLVPHDSSYVMCDGPYIVHVRDPGTAPPNLASVQEIAGGILRVAARVLVDQAELWLDDIRLSDVVQDAGMAAAMDVTLAAANLADVAVSLSRRDGDFRQLGEDPSHQTESAATLAGTVRLERFLPERWGLAAPLTLRYAATESDPFYLRRTDLRADALEGLRTPSSTAQSWGLVLRRARRATTGLAQWVLDPLTLSASYTTGRARGDLARATSSSYAVNVDYVLSPPPGPAVWIAGRPIRVTPTSLRLRSSLTDARAERFTYQVPVARPADAGVAPARSLATRWRNSATLELAPVDGLQLRVDVSSQRDLRHYGDSTPLGRVLEAERRSLLGRDIGVETQRALGTSLAVAPRLGTWLRPRATLSSSFALTRDANARQPVRGLGDTAGAFHVPAAFSNSRQLDLGTQIDLRSLGRALAGDSGGLARLLERVSPLDVSFGRTRASVFDRAPFTPSLEYQLALGGLDAFRGEQGRRASAATQNDRLSAGGGVALPLGLRVTATYQETSGETWALRTDAQIPIRTHTRDWPSLSAGWSLTPSGTLLGRVLTSLGGQLGYRRREARAEQPTFVGGGAGSALARSTERHVTPSVALVWAGGVLTAFDAALSESEQLNAGSLFRTRQSRRNASLTFTFRPPASVVRLPTGVEATARWTAFANRTCLRAAGRATCVPYVDSRQTQAQLSLATDFPPNISAGLQMAYVLNDERQADRKVAQLVITAFVNLTTTVGRLP